MQHKLHPVRKYKMKNPSELSIASTSDVHMGHPRNESSHVYKSIQLAFPMNHETSKLDILAIAGDFFDGLLNLPDDAVTECDLAMLWILRLCAKYGITLILLEGTPSHDRGQTKRFLFLNDTFHIGAEVYYFDKVCVHHFDKFNIDVLFVPDRANPTVEKTFEQVKERMAERGLTKVDYAFVHGTFKHQLPEYVKTEKHDTDAYLALVRYLIFGGHIHQYSRYGNFISHGSLDRLVHGEEEPKGHIRARVRSETDMDVTFVENLNARIFKTIDCTGLDTDAAMEKISKVLLTVPESGFVRVISEPGSPILSALLTLEKRWPTFNWTVMAAKTKEAEMQEIEAMNAIAKQLEYDTIHISRDNVVELVEQKLRANQVDSVIANRSLELLKRIR